MSSSLSSTLDPRLARIVSQLSLTSKVFAKDTSPKPNGVVESVPKLECKPGLEHETPVDDESTMGDEPTTTVCSTRVNEVIRQLKGAKPSSVETVVNKTNEEPKSNPFALPPYAARYYYVHFSFCSQHNGYKTIEHELFLQYSNIPNQTKTQNLDDLF